MRTIDINADLGEGLGHDQALLEIVSSANIAGGGHAGSPAITRETVAICREKSVRIGAHPGYPDPEYFGRRTFAETGLSVSETLDSLIAQVELIPEAVYIKPHGALYNEAAAEIDSPAGELVTKIIERFGLPIMGLPDSGLAQIADRCGIPLIKEGFIDRFYDLSGRLIPRTNPRSMITDPETCVTHVFTLAGRCDSLCIHGDTPGAIAMAARVRIELEKQGWRIGW